MRKKSGSHFIKEDDKTLIKSASLSAKNHTQQKFLVSLLPMYATPKKLLLGDGLPCHGAKIESNPIEFILKTINRQTWSEGLYAKQMDLNNINRYKNPNGSYKNDFDKKQFLDWVSAIENNTALCEMENNNIGKGVFVPPGKILPRGVFIPSSGIIKLDPTIEELETKVHCSALQNLNSPEKKIVGLIDPEEIGGILNFINHAPDKEEIINFIFKADSTKENVATSNLRSTIKFYDGYAIMGLEAHEDINGNDHGTQLLWSYARSCEYLISDQSRLKTKRIILFDNRNKHNGEIIDTREYALRVITIFIDTGELILRKVASLTRWELMESSPESGLIISTEDPYSITQSKTVQSLIPHKFLQAYLKQNPMVNRVIIQAPILKEMNLKLEKKDKK